MKQLHLPVVAAAGLCAWASCVLTPTLEGRPCNSQDDCVTGFQCTEGVCQQATDAGAIVDAGPQDAGPGPQDAGAGDDAGASDDAGVGEDAGPPEDAGEPDAGAPDGGVVCGSHDEDSDGVPDGCDNCPHLSNAGQEDVGETTTGNLADGVGDACDPRPSAPGDAIALFEPWAALDTSRWEASTSGASISTDALVLAADQLSPEGLRLERALAAPPARPVVEIGIGSYTNPGIGDAGGAMLVSAAGQRLACVIYDDQGPGVGWLDVPTTGVSEVVGTGTSAPSATSAATLRLDARASPARCEIPGASATLSAGSVGNQRVGVYAERATLRVRYLVLFAVGP